MCVCVLTTCSKLFHEEVALLKSKELGVQSGARSKQLTSALLALCGVHSFPGLCHTL